MNQISPGIYRKGNQILTKNLVPGFRSHGEEILKIKKEEYRVWDPNRSKPCAGIMKGLKSLPIKPGMKILYLGIASGSTASFFSDIIGPKGMIYGIEISERSIRDLNPIAQKRGNIAPILANAKRPQDYNWIEPVDLVYQDVATNDQSEIIIRNAKEFLKPGGFAILAIKSRSIDVVKEPRKVYRQELKKLKQYFEILWKIELDPYERDHCFILMKKKG